TIYRTFHINVISDADKYYLMDTLLMIPVIISIAGIFSISSLFYYLNRKKINKNLSNEKQ
ncbi:MAG: hypothetical protein ACFFAU_20775, partial [Candidatus Hodarchaeota archaeon]